MKFLNISESSGVRPDNKVASFTLSAKLFTRETVYCVNFCVINPDFIMLANILMTIGTFSLFWPMNLW